MLVNLLMKVYIVCIGMDIIQHILLRNLNACCRQDNHDDVEFHLDYLC